VCSLLLLCFAKTLLRLLYTSHTIIVLAQWFGGQWPHTPLFITQPRAPTGRVRVFLGAKAIRAAIPFMFSFISFDGAGIHYEVEVEFCGKFSSITSIVRF
jgi:hypothetical protein